MSEPKLLRAIDLYSGIGGWSLGLHMAGIEVVSSYEWWKKAARTNEKNNGHKVVDADIRELELKELPADIDIVVGSPPCTQFSFANRGGTGDIEDGLRDVEKFLEIVDYLEPRYWAMENVPRTAEIIRQRLQRGASLEKFSKLLPNIFVLDMSEWGLPQGRKRCIIGNFDFGLLYQYRNLATPRILRDVVEALSRSTVLDPTYGIRIPHSRLTDHQVEDYLSFEEERLNREMKTHHPVYNNMSFPDSLDRPARTITATCTRVSRESVVIEDLETQGRYRRLSVRERACLQGFPITYQFYGDSYAEKLKMIGNAVPPLMTFYIAQAMLNRKPEEALSPREAIATFVPPGESPPQTLPDKPGNIYPMTRRFRLAIPGLRFKSGVRFELANMFIEDEIRWQVGFYYGDSKNIQRINLSRELLNSIQNDPLVKNVARQIVAIEEAVKHALFQTSSKELQKTWVRASKKGAHPFAIVDKLGMLAGDLEQTLEEHQINTREILAAAFEQDARGLEKVLRHSRAILAGLIVGSAANIVFDDDLFLSLGTLRKARAN
jgi:DNA (cytosine-5)-methyltransferase 1